jgi:hypothetical protein
MPRKLKGIHRRREGWRVCVRVHRKLYTKQFPFETPTETMRAWREEQIQQFRTSREDVAHQLKAAAFEAQRLPCSEKTWCYVYFARSGAVVKIGRSVDPAQRVREIQTMHPGELVLLASVAAHMALEAAIHQRFAHLRTRATGEWFRLEPDLIAFIHAIQQGANPVALLFEDPRVVLGWYLHPSPAAAAEGIPPCLEN